MVWKAQGISLGYVRGGRGGTRGGELVERAADRLGWKAMPFARDDLDSNCKGQRGQQQDEHVEAVRALRKADAWQSTTEQGRTFVSIPAEDCILAERGPEAW